jgi:hypothetical protein
MRNYRNKFKGYLADLAAKKPAPGGGSVAALVFCLGRALMEKAIVYSLSKSPQLSRGLKDLKADRAKTFPYIDRDAELFAKVIAAQGKSRIAWLKRSEALTLDLGSACLRAAGSYRAGRSLIKKGILSDFDLGIKLIETALNGSLDSLYANAVMFGKLNLAAAALKKGLKSWPRS